MGCAQEMKVSELSRCDSSNSAMPGLVVDLNLDRACFFGFVPSPSYVAPGIDKAVAAAQLLNRHASRNK